MLEISVTNLFGHFNYNFQLTDTGLTILTGPNGFGKSTILNCLNAISNSDLMFFAELKFEQFKVVSKNTGSKFCVKKIENGLLVDGNEINEKDLAFRKRGLSRVNNSMYDNHMTENVSGEVYNQIITQMREMLGEVRFIREQRLIGTSRKLRNMETGSRGEVQIHEVVEEIPRKLTRQIREVDSNYSQVSNELDSTYPMRLFQQEKGITQDEFSQKLQLMKERVEKLNSVGISNMRELEIDKFRNEDARALQVYFEDFEKKYREYEELVERLQLFAEIVNKRFMFKKIETSGMYGLRVLDSISGGKMKLSSLSSGEKEIVVLFYTLLFEIPDKAFLLIDEPEISLHIAWQRLFASDLKEIARLKALNVLVATHSPQIITGNMDIQIDLGELYKNGLNKSK